MDFLNKTATNIGIANSGAGYWSNQSRMFGIILLCCGSGLDESRMAGTSNAG